jgi:MFS family permease
MSVMQINSHSNPRVADPRRWMALTVLVCLQFMLILDATVVNVALPSIKTGLAFSQSNLAWVVDAYLLVAGGFLLLGGRLADLFGRRRIFLTGAIAFALGSLASALAQDQAMLISSRALQGLGEALAGPAALSIVTVLFLDPKERARALSIWGGLGGAAGVLLGGVIVDLADWRWIFWINLPVAVAVIFASLRLVPSDRRRAPRGFDAAGAVTATGGITALVYALLEANRNGWTPAPPWTCSQPVPRSWAPSWPSRVVCGPPWSRCVSLALGASAPQSA